ncbi:hypothetical protein pb186bvf_004298 [Paramecium bursaria]
MILFIFLALAQQAIDELSIKGNLVSKQLILSGEAKCNQLQADRIVTQELEITTTFSSEILQLNSLSPLRSGKRTAFIEMEGREPDNIYFSGNAEFTEGLFRDDDGEDEQTTIENTIQTEFIEIHGQSQWIPVVLSTFEGDEQLWKVMKKNEQTDDVKLRQLLKQNSFFDHNHDHFKKEKLDLFEFELHEQALSSKVHETIVFQFNHLPNQHTYVNVLANFYILTDIWRHGSKIWMKVDGELAWLQSHNNRIHGLCQYLQHSIDLLNQDEIQKLQTEIDAMQQQYWQVPIQLAIKHIRHKIHIEFGISLGSLPECSYGQRQLFQELENRFKLYAVDDFTLEYK